AGGGLLKLLDTCKIPDPMGLIPFHFLCGIISVLAVSFTQDVAMFEQITAQAVLVAVTTLGGFGLSGFLVICFLLANYLYRSAPDTARG
ncbi:MAG: hypothetical protein AAF226_14095, partial [Verrucomicrobiota bacterium]